MTVSEFLSGIAQVGLVIMAILTLIDFARFRGQARLDIALMFGSLGAIVLLQGLLAALRQQTPWITQVGAVLLLSQPYFLLRLVQHFRRVPRLVIWAAIVSVAISWLLLLLIPLPRPRPLTLIIIACFVWVEGYAALAFIRGARQAGGVTRPRLALAATGSGMLMLVLILAGINQVLPSNIGLTGPLAGIMACLAMVSYFLGFTPPRWLHQSWQFVELRRFLGLTAGQPAAKRAELAIDELCMAGIHTAGGLVAAVAIWDAAHQQLKVDRSSAADLAVGSLLPRDDLIGRAWRDQQPVIAPTLSDLGGVVRALAGSVDAHALLAVPIATPTHAWGMLLVLFHRVPLFASADLHVLRLLAEQSAIALDYAALLSAQQELVVELSQRTAQVEATNKELEAFSYSVAHDLRAPLRSLAGFSQALLEDYGRQLDSQGTNYLHRITAAAQRMGDLIDGLLALSRITRGDLQRQPVDLTAMTHTIALELQQRSPERKIGWKIDTALVANGDIRLLHVLLENLLINAWKFTAPREHAQIEVGVQVHDQEGPVYFVRDNGVGFDMTYADKLFGVFQRLHGANEFEGTGIGLATVQRIVHRHRGRIWATSAIDQGATFFFTL